MFNFWCTYRQIELIIKKKKLKTASPMMLFPLQHIGKQAVHAYGKVQEGAQKV